MLATAAMLSGCEGGMLGGNEGAPVDVQVAHPAGVVLQVLKVSTGSERTAIELIAMNGRDREIRLNQGRENSFILTDGGEKLLLVPAANNTALAVPGTRRANMTLVFAGALPASGNATLVLNESGSSESYSSNPRFQIDIPLANARGAVPEASSMSDLRAVPATSLRPARSEGSSLGTAAQGASSLQAVEALKSELNAVETERGTIVSLPGDVTFDFDKATIQPDARPTLDRLANLIDAGGSGAITIEGHTDSKGNDAYNRRLSLDRAEAVKAYLVEKGVAADRLRTLGLGETRPAVANALPDGSDDEAGRQRNRRVEVILPNTPQTAGPEINPPAG
jgi:outer membrane protein OmpA-like peptidoglycan-associated protein